jgi:hypothetical protein
MSVNPIVMDPAYCDDVLEIVRTPAPRTRQALVTIERANTSHIGDEPASDTSTITLERERLRRRPLTLPCSYLVGFLLEATGSLQRAGSLHVQHDPEPQESGPSSNDGCASITASDSGRSASENQTGVLPCDARRRFICSSRSTTFANSSGSSRRISFHDCRE